MDNLVTIKEIENIEPHTNADSLELATVDGWQIVVKKGQFKKGDWCVYCALDTVLPYEEEDFAFLVQTKGRVKPCRLRKEVSMGLCFPMKVLEDRLPIPQEFEVGANVGYFLKATKYTKPLPACEKAKGNFPIELVRKTDETNIQSAKRLLGELDGHKCYFAEKVDGQSATFIKTVDGEFKVCSRNLDLKESEDSKFWQIASKYNLKEKMPDGMAIQGELYGEGVQSNPLGIKGNELAVFNIFSLKDKAMFPLHSMQSWCEENKVPMVRVLREKYFDQKEDTIKALVDYAAKVKYKNGAKAEGVVVRPFQPFISTKLNKELSFKVLNPDYKH